MVADPAGELEKILRNPDDPEREARFQTLLAEEEKELEKSIRRRRRNSWSGMEFIFPTIAANS